MELCGIKALSFAIGLYLPISTTLPIFAGGAIRGIIDAKHRKKGLENGEDEDLRKGNLFATGLVAGGALAGVIVAFMQANTSINANLQKVSREHGLTEALGQGGYFVLGVLFFAIMGLTLYRVGLQKNKL
jgi:hypothetical protein